MTAITDLPLTDRCIACALERLASEAQRDTDSGDPAERTFFRRWAGAYRKALWQFLQGVRVQPTPYGGWLVPSATRGGVVHSVAADGHCSCEAQGRGCWHAALTVGVEVGQQAAAEDKATAYADMAELFSD